MWEYCGNGFKELDRKLEMGYTCEYCGNILTTRTNLHKHQRNAKYCLKLQGVQPKEEATFACSCGCVYSRADSLQRHQKKCTGQQPTQQTPQQPTDYEHLTKMFADIQNEKMDKLLTKMVNIITTTKYSSKNAALQNLSPITDEQLSENLERLTLNYIWDGAKGYADFANYYPLKNNIICTDRARKRIRYKNSAGELTDDSRALAKRFFTAILPKNEEIINAKYTELLTKVQNVVNDRKAGEVDVSALLTKATALQDMLIKCRNAANGEDDAFTEEFIRHLTRTL